MFVLLGIACPGSSFSEEGGAFGRVCCAVLSLLAFASFPASLGWEGRLVFLSGACPGKCKAKVEASFGNAQLPAVDPRKISPSGDIAVGSFAKKHSWCYCGRRMYKLINYVHARYVVLDSDSIE